MESIVQAGLLLKEAAERGETVLEEEEDYTDGRGGRGGL